MARCGFYPGSFDPVTYGHLDIIARAARLVDELVIGVGVHASKQALLAPDRRVVLIEEVVKPVAAATGCTIRVVTFDGLAVAAARKEQAEFIIRGIRDATDFDYEVKMSQMNAAMSGDLETVFLAASTATRMIASALVKQVARMGGDITPFVPPEARAAVTTALKYGS